MEEELIRLLPARTGHFRLESGHHGNLWLDLDAVLLRPARIRRFVAELARRLSAHDIDAVCGPLVGGAFVAQMIAIELDVECLYSERLARPQSAALYAVEYQIPSAMRGVGAGKRVAIVDDVINAGAAVRGTFADLQAWGAKPAVIGALLVLGDAASRFATDNDIPLERIVARPNAIWTPVDCPLCAAGVPLEDPAG